MIKLLYLRNMAKNMEYIELPQTKIGLLTIKYHENQISQLLLSIIFLEFTKLYLWIESPNGHIDDKIRPQKYVCFRSPDRLTIFSPTYSGFFIMQLKVLFIGDHIEKKVNRTTLREVMRF